MPIDSTQNTKIQLQNQGNTLFIASGGKVYTDQGIGTPNAAATLSTEENFGHLHTTVLTFTNFPITMTDHTTAGCHGTAVLYTMPKGAVYFLGTLSQLTFTTSGSGCISATASLVASLGSAALSTSDATLTSTEADILSSQAATLTGGTSSIAVAGAGIALGAYNSTGAINLNLAVPDAGSTDNGTDTITVTGSIRLHWINRGSN